MTCKSGFVFTFAANKQNLKMKKIYYMLATIMLLSNFVAKADEGMWIPLLLKKYNYEAMKAKGLKLTPEQLYDVNNSSLKDAIVWFNGGCTGEIISKEGLVLTNHHCGYDAIAANSSPKNNILDSGFWAKNHGQEIPVPGMWVSIVQRIEDISDKVFAELKGVDEKGRAAKIQEVYKKLIAEATTGNTYEAQCREMFKGNAYYLFVFQRYNDIRLVGAPPQSIGKFGGETDNWMWPRHTGDFSMFRIYASKENKAASYAPDNVPYQPKHSLPINIKGYKKGDFAMIYGFPGRTNRYEFSKGVQVTTDLIDPAIVALRDVRLNAWKEQMNKDVDIRLKLSSDFASVANYWKYFAGEAEQLKKNKVYEIKIKEELAFTKWAKDKTEYNTLLSDMDSTFAAFKPISLQRIYINEGILAPNISKYVSYATSLEETMLKGDAKKIATAKEQLKEAIKELPYDPMIATADKRIFDSILVLYYNNIPKDQQVALMGEIINKYNAANPREAIKMYTDYVFDNSIFSDEALMRAWFNNPRPAALKNDPAYIHVKAFRDHYINTFKPRVDKFNEHISLLGRIYIKGLMEMNPKRNFYPDANSSVRLTYGTVKPYMKFPLITNLDEVVVKHQKNMDNPEFNVPQRLLDLHKSKTYGHYAMKDGKLPVAFLTDNDITGGNSGSPVIDGEGQIIGLAFDGNWEAMSGNIHFDPANKRTICVDIRYVMFLIDIYGEAPHIVKEMKLIE